MPTARTAVDVITQTGRMTAPARYAPPPRAANPSLFRATTMLQRRPTSTWSSTSSASVSCPRAPSRGRAILLSGTDSFLDYSAPSGVPP